MNHIIRHGDNRHLRDIVVSFIERLHPEITADIGMKDCDISQRDL